ncbi:hypothetical protein C0992_010939 [Termitomyces sp. T32_za158]|nr:hypothetical protein C0992_010939 [Termitomyces sp. T32_za158]
MSKKTGKSAAGKEKEAATYRERDIVLGKVRGFPPWPGMVVDPDAVPPAVANERPAKKSSFYCVQFFPAGDYAWLVAKDISRLQPLEIEAYINEPFKKSGDLLAGYRTALDPAAWEAKRAAALAAEGADDGEDDGEGAPEDAGEDVDELASEHEGDARKRRASVGGAGKKRKREKEGAGAGAGKRDKEGKTRKGKAPATPTVRGKGRKPKSSAVVESEDERGDADDDAEGDDVPASARKKPASPPPAKKQRRDDDNDDLQNDQDAIQVRDWRHKLQKAFLSAKSTPDDADMPALDKLFATVEAYTTMTVSQLQFSKIGKVMRHITHLEDKRVPRDAEFSFRARAQALVERWQSVLGAAKSTPSKKDDEKEGLNGVNGEPAPPVEEPSKLEPNGASADVDMAGPADADAPGEADGEGEGEGEAEAEAEAEAEGERDGEGEAAGQADAPGEAEDAVMA